MREHLLGRTPRLTAYFCGISVSLSVLVAGMEAARLTIFGSFSGDVAPVYAAIGAVCAVGLAFVAGYLNGSVLASWAAGFVPAAARLGGPIADGSLSTFSSTLAGAAGTGVVLGAVGFVLAVEKHRLDARSADLPEPPSRSETVGVFGVSVVFGVGLSALRVALSVL